MSPQPHRGGGGARRRWIPSLLESPQPHQGGGRVQDKEVKAWAGRRAPSLLKSPQSHGGGGRDEVGAPSLIKEGVRRTRRGPGGPGGGQEDQEGARSRRAPSLLQRRKTRRGEFHISSHRCKIIPGWSVGWLGGWSDRCFPICLTKVSVKLTKMSWC